MAGVTNKEGRSDGGEATILGRIVDWVVALGVLSLWLVWIGALGWTTLHFAGFGWINQVQKTQSRPSIISKQRTAMTTATQLPVDRATSTSAQ